VVIKIVIVIVVIMEIVIMAGLTAWLVFLWALPAEREVITAITATTAMGEATRAREVGDLLKCLIYCLLLLLRTHYTPTTTVRTEVTATTAMGEATRASEEGDLLKCLIYCLLLLRTHYTPMTTVIITSKIRTAVVALAAVASTTARVKIVILRTFIRRIYIPKGPH